MEMISWVGFVNKNIFTDFCMAKRKYPPVKMLWARHFIRQLYSILCIFHLSIEWIWNASQKKYWFTSCKCLLCVKRHAFLVALRYEVSCCCCWFFFSKWTFVVLFIWYLAWPLLFAPDNIWHNNLWTFLTIEAL